MSLPNNKFRRPLSYTLNNYQLLNRDLINNKYFEQVMVKSSGLKGEYKSDIFGIGNRDIVLEEIQGCTYDHTKKLYCIPVDFNQEYVYSVLEIINKDINKQYTIVETDIESGLLWFQQEDEFYDIISSLKNSTYIVAYTYDVNKYIQENISETISIQSDFDEYKYNAFYFIVRSGENLVKLYGIDITTIGEYIETEDLTFDDVIQEIQDQTSIVEIENVVTHFGEYDLQADNTIEIDDLEIVFNDISIINNLETGEEQDQLYFYVNRTDGFTIFVNEYFQDLTNITTEELEDLLKFSNQNYIIKGTIYLSGNLPISIQNKNNITINGDGLGQAKINVVNQTFTGRNSVFEIKDSKNILFKDLRVIQADDLDGETEYIFVDITQTVTDQRTSDQITLENVFIENLDTYIEIDGDNIYSIKPPRIYVGDQKLRTLYLDRIKDISSIQTSIVPPSLPINPTSLQFEDLKLGDGTDDLILWDQQEEMLHFESANSQLKLLFNGISNTIVFKMQNIQNEIHTHNQNDLSEVLTISLGGTNQYSYGQINSLISFNGTEFVSGKTLYELNEHILDQIEIGVNDQTEEKFSVGQTDSISFESENTDLSIGFNRQQKLISFNLYIPVRSVNSETGDVDLDTGDIGQQEDSHTHDEYFLLGGDIIKPNTDSNKVFTINLSNNNSFMAINTILKDIKLYNDNKIFLQINDDKFRYKSFNIKKITEGYKIYQ